MTLTATYGQNYVSGFDCRMTTFRNNLAFYGHNVTNGMILGLSGCLSFIYSTPEKSRIPFYTILGITDQTLEGLCSVYDTYLTRGEYPFQSREILEALRDNLEKGILVNAAINRPLLNHIRQGKDVMDFIVEPTNVGFHFVTITGVENNNITFFETDYAKPLTIDIETFMHLWFYDSIYGREVFDAHQMCNGKYYTIQPPGVEAEKSKNTLLFSIDKVANSFFTTTKSYSHGMNGMTKFFSELEAWDDHLDKGCLINSIFFMKILEMNLSGGGFGRRLYSFFLAETAALLGDDQLKLIAAEFRTTYKIWSDFVNALCSRGMISRIVENDFIDLKLLASKYGKEIIRAESSQFENLRHWIASK